MTDPNESKGDPAAVGNPLLTLKNELLLNAVVRGELPTVRRLLDRHGADINSVNFSGLNCLQLAILNGHTKLAEYLIQKGVNIHMVDMEGYSPLHDASLMNNTTLVRKLICKGVTPMVANNQGELPIDVAGSIAMERLLCEEMCIKGELSLARQYYFYLGLQRLSDTEVYELPRSTWARNAVHSSNRGQRHSRYGGPTSAKCHITTGSTPKSPSKTRWPGAHVRNAQVTSVRNAQVTGVRNAQVTGVTPYQLSSFNSPRSASDDVDLRNTCYAVSQSGNEDTLERLPTIDNSATDGSHTRPDNGMSVLAKVFKDTNREESEQSESCPSTPSNSSLSSDSNSSLGQVEEVRKPFERHPPSVYEYTPTRRKKQRESTAINSLFQHSSFQLQIGFSLSHLGQGSSLDDEDDDYTDLSGDSGNHTTTLRSSPRNSPASLRKLKSSSFDSDSDFAVNSKTTAVPVGESNQGNLSPTSIIRQGKSKPPLRKTVSFADVSMTRTRPVSYPSGIRNSTTNDQGTKSSVKSGSRMNLSPAELAHLSEIFKDNIDKSSNSDEEGEGDFEAGIKALKMKPRKSSIASPQRRRSSDGRRRSVSFQPEVLLQEIVIDGDAKAINRMLQSGVIEDVNKMSPAGLTALHQSAIDGNLECAKALVANGANVNCMDVESWTPLHASAMTGRVEFVRFLLSVGANPSLKNNTGETPYDIAKNGQIRKMLLHAMNGKSPDADVFSDGEYSGGEEEEEYSHAESDSEDEDSEGAGELFDPNSSSQKPSLKERLGLNHSSALKNTQETSTSPSPDQDGPDVFSGESKDILDIPKKSREPTDSTSSYGSLYEPELERISELDTDSTSNNRKSKPALEQPQTTLSDTDKVSEDQGISTMDGSTSDCSHRSRILSEDEGTLRDALDKDLVPGSANYKFQEACLYCDIDSVLKLVRHKDEIDVNRVNTTSGITALHHSVLEENFALVQHLVKDFEVNIHAQDRDGWTPLHAASAVGNIRIAQFLLENGAKASALNNSCEFPVDVAEDKAIEKLLKNAMLGSVGNRL